MTMFPVGIYYCFKNLTEQNIFIIMYGMTSIYFAGVMVRLMLVLAPVMCILSGIGISSVLVTYMKNIEASAAEQSAPAANSTSGKGGEKKAKKGDENYPKKSEASEIISCPRLWMCFKFVPLF